MRGPPYCFPTADALPPTEEATRHFIPGAEQAVDRLGMSLAETVGLAGAERSYSLTPPRRRLTISFIQTGANGDVQFAGVG